MNPMLALVVSPMAIFTVTTKVVGNMVTVHVKDSACNAVCTVRSAAVPDLEARVIAALRCGAFDGS
jgi:hypothetical protein